MSDDHFMGFPGLFNGASTNGEGVRNQRLIAGYNRNRDAVGAGSVVLRESTDGGGVWGTFASADGYLQPMNFVRLPVASGAVYAIDFEDLYTTRGTDADGNPNCAIQWCREVFNRRMLAGSTWVDVAEDAKVYFAGKTVAWARFHQGPILMSDGRTMLSTMYGRYGQAHGWTWFTGVVRSGDGGQNWSLVHEFSVTAAQSFAEPSLAPTSDGGLIAVLRKDENFKSRAIPSNVALYTVRSSDQTGENWGAPILLSSDGGNSPSVELLGNGSLVLASGRTDNQLRFSYDGRGTTWDGPYRPWTNYPTTGGETSGEFAGWYRYDADASGCCLYRPMRHLGSSGTMGVEAISGNQAFVIGDNCGSGWGCPCPWGAGWMCPQRAGGYTRGTTHGLWKTTVTVNNGRAGRLDLPAMFRADQLTVAETAFSRYGLCPDGIAGCRQSYAAFAFDGDIRSDTSLVTPNRSVTLRLPRAYQLTGVGLHMNLQGPADARIQVSTDGVTFTTPARAARDGYLRPFASPVTAQYVRISDPNTITNTLEAFLNEVELYGS
ncbi:hypothetical protein E1212_02680 [Jiangella ureilytica]|uniref:Exo-alpha-sialidase n=1 Tax=Jiangella ureilytica TaxID=2530374 RepID=A0A4R4RX92_9ACTN|nr:hypothetical protein E1212_02680 [Jiangella ureilytica]